MFEGLKRLYRRIEAALETPPDSVDERRPQRVNPDPPKNDWYARTSKCALGAAAKNETAALDRLDAMAPRLSREASATVDELLAKASASSGRR